MTEDKYNIVSLNQHEDINIFDGNTVVVGPVHDNATVIVRGGSLFVTGDIGRDTQLCTRQKNPMLQRAAAKITDNLSYFPVPPKLALKIGSWQMAVNPLSIVILSKPQNLSEEDALFELPQEYPMCTINSARDVFFLRDTPERIMANVVGSFLCYGKLGTLSCVNSGKGAYIDAIGDICTVTTSGIISTKKVGACVTLSCAKRVLLGPSKRSIKWQDSAASVGGAFEVFGQLSSTDGINARIVTHEGGYSPYQRKYIPATLPPIEKMIVG